MAVSLRLTAEKLLDVNSSWLSPRIGCGQMLSGIPRYSGSEVLRDVMREYGYDIVHADKQATKLLDNNDSLVRTFCSNFEGTKMPIKVNYRSAFGLKDLFLVLDLITKSAYFIASPESKLALNNYFRDAMPGLMQNFKVTLGGSTNRLTPIGWQNLHDVMTEGNFRIDFPEVQKIEIMSTLPGARWRQPTLEVGVQLMNFTEAKAIRLTIFKEVRKIA